MSIFNYLIIARSYLKTRRVPSSSQTPPMTSQKSESYISEIDNVVYQFQNGQLDPKYHQNLVQTLLDTDLHLTRYPEMIQYCDYMIQEGFCYYVNQ
jgi:hypothetical protein